MPFFVCMQQSDQPMYRISALEGQLKMSEEKLIEIHRQQDELLKNERSRNKERVANLKAEFGGKLEEAAQTITTLQTRMSELERCLDKAASKSPPDIRIDTPTPPIQGSPISTRRRKHKRKSNTKSPEETAEESSGLSSELQQRSASFADLSVTGKSQEEESDGRRNGAAESFKLSPEIQRSQEVNGKFNYQRRPSNTERMSITTLVEESLRNPSSIASIRKQLKSEGLTPKIERKFPKKPSTPTTLPSMNQKDGFVKETSPLTKETKA